MSVFAFVAFVLFQEGQSEMKSLVDPTVTRHLNPGITLVCFQSFSGVNCNVSALKSRTVALKTRTKFLVKFVRDIRGHLTKRKFMYVCRESM